MGGTCLHRCHCYAEFIPSVGRLQILKVQLAVNTHFWIYVRVYMCKVISLFGEVFGAEYLNMLYSKFIQKWTFLNDHFIQSLHTFPCNALDNGMLTVRLFCLRGRKSKNVRGFVSYFQNYFSIRVSRTLSRP